MDDKMEKQFKELSLKKKILSCVFYSSIGMFCFFYPYTNGGIAKVLIGVTSILLGVGSFLFYHRVESR